MPAAKAVLRDIADIGLDPRVAHSRCAHDGRLVAPAAPAAHATTVSAPACKPLLEVTPESEVVFQEPEPIEELEPVKEHEPDEPEGQKAVEKVPEKAPVADTKKAAKPKRP